MHRFYLPPAESQSDVLQLSARDAHHARHVLRVRDGERLVVLDGSGHEILCEVIRTDRLSVILKALQKTPIPALPWQVTLFQAVPKGKTMDTIVQKATELGVHRIVPILSERTVPHVADSAGSEKAAKWRTTAIEAIKQCGSAWLPSVEAPASPQSFFATGERFELALIASLQSDARHPREHFDAFIAEKKRPPKSVA